MLKTKLLGATAAAQALAIEDVFSTYLYTGNGSTQTITNGIDLAGEGGLVWIKSRSAATNNFLFDTLRGTTDEINSNTTDAEASLANSLTAFNADGFSIGSATGIGVNAATYASWTFRKAERFFDVVTYTGTGANRTVAHNLGVVPGCIMVKCTSSSGDWQVYHRANTAAPETDFLVLNSTAATVDADNRWNDTAPTDTEFTVGSRGTVNGSGATYVAYLFAHDPLGPSGDGSDGLIACGSYTGTGVVGNQITLGWEPQYVMVKNASSTGSWWIQDSMRGLPVSGFAVLYANNTSDEAYSSTTYFSAASNGFTVNNTISEVNASGNTYIYIAIRRGPMRAPTSGTEVFAQAYRGEFGLGEPHYYSGFVTDMVLNRRAAVTDSTEVYSRMTGGPRYLITDSTAAEASNPNNRFDFMTGFGASGTTVVLSDLYSWMFRRAPGFFDVVAYTGNSTVGRTVPHNLGVAPEMMIVKRRDGVASWAVYHSGISNNGSINLNTTAEADPNDSSFNNTAPTNSVFSVGGGLPTNYINYTYIAYLFATLPGVSKVGSYTGNGSNQTINCGFTGGARFVLIKRTDNTGDWYVWDTARGIVAGNDPYLSLNTTAAQVTTIDSIDPDSSGFIVNQLAATNINVNAASYIYLSIS